MKWRSDVDPAERVFQMAARLQHQYVIRIRTRMKETGRGMTVKQYAGEVGSSYDRIVKIFRGETILRLEDIAAADEVVGDVSAFAIRDPESSHAAEQDADRLRELVREKDSEIESFRRAARAAQFREFRRSS